MVRNRRTWSCYAPVRTALRWRMVARGAATVEHLALTLLCMTRKVVLAGFSEEQWQMLVAQWMNR